MTDIILLSINTYKCLAVTYKPRRGYIYPLPLIVVGDVERRPLLLSRPSLSTMRETTISVSSEEKAALDELKLELYGTNEIPYGVVIAELTERVTDDK